MRVLCEKGMEEADPTVVESARRIAFSLDIDDDLVLGTYSFHNRHDPTRFHHIVRHVLGKLDGVADYGLERTVA